MRSEEDEEDGGEGGGRGGRGGRRGGGNMRSIRHPGRERSHAARSSPSRRPHPASSRQSHCRGRCTEAPKCNERTRRGTERQ